MPNLKTLCLITLLTIFCGSAFSQHTNNVRWVCQSTLAPASHRWLMHYKKKTYTLDSIQAKSGILNLNHVENIVVLKDAAATALYGSSAAGGVTIITLKKRYAKAEFKRLKPYLSKI
jgi:TonB-dependent SusC/RagA subfamily outer membrane receptor